MNGCEVVEQQLRLVLGDMGLLMQGLSMMGSGTSWTCMGGCWRTVASWLMK